MGAIEGAGGTAGAAPGPVGSSNIRARSEGSGSGATGGAVGAVDGAVGAVDGAARVGGGAGVAGSSGWTRPGTVVVVGAGGRHGAEARAQAWIPPRPLAGSGVNPASYLAFSASRSAFQRWPGACGKGQGRGLGKRGLGERSQDGVGREGLYGARDKGHAGAEEEAVVAEL